MAVKKPAKTKATPRASSAASDSSTLAENRKAFFDYEILERYDAGIELTGIEVKAARDNKVSLAGSHVSIRGGEAYLMNADIAPYQINNTADSYEPKHARRLLLKKNELRDLADHEAKKGLTIVPISMYSSRGRGQKIKVSIAVVRGKKKFDKRQSIKKRDTDREISREFAL